MFLYHLFLHFWLLVAGSSEFSLRLPSALFAAATIPLVYQLGKELYDYRVGLIAALLLTVNASSIHYGQEARSYALLGMLAVISTLYFLRSLRNPSLANCAAYVVAGALSVSAHQFGILLLPAQWLSLFVWRPERRTINRLTAAAIAFGILALPSFARVPQQAAAILVWVPTTTFSSLLQIGEFLAGKASPLGRLGTGLSVFYVAAVSGAIVTAVRQETRRPAVAFLLLLAILPIIIAIAVSFVQPVLVDRFFLVCQPFVILLAAIGIWETIPRRALIVPLAAVVVLALVQDNLYYGHRREDWRSAVTYVADNAQPGDALIVCVEVGVRAVNYYVRRLDHPENFPRIVFPVRDQFDYDRASGIVRAEQEPPPELDQFIDHPTLDPHQRVWLILSHTRQPPSRQHATLLLISALKVPGRRVLLHHQFSEVRVMLFEPTVPSPRHE
jgi:mannosyltransferase